MLARVLRSGLVEAEHRGVVAVSDAEGTLLFSSGDVDRPYWLRSAAKPFQAAASQAAGAELLPEQLALACGSHGGQPIHVAIVEGMLEEAGLEESALRCPAAWPRAETARDRLVAAGERYAKPVWHGCSGKHTAMLRACAARGWPLETYVEPRHPLQEEISAVIAEAVGAPVGPVGVDGCGVPVHKASAAGMARAYAMLARDPSKQAVWSCMHRFPGLTQDGPSPAARISTWLDACAKSGAEGTLGVSLRSGVGLAVKSWDGSSRPLAIAVLEALRVVGLGPAYVGELLEGELRGSSTETVSVAL